MHQFLRIAPLALTKLPDPGMDDRSGPPLSRGNLFTMLATVASEELSKETLALLTALDVDAWYGGQDCETLLNQLEDKDASLPEILGRHIYFMFRTPLRQAGFLSASQFLTGLPSFWLLATRGDSGVWRSRMLGERHFHVEAEQPYNCLFEMGGMRGFIDAFDGRNVQIEHRTCMRRGDPFCTFDTRWDE